MSYKSSRDILEDAWRLAENRAIIEYVESLDDGYMYNSFASYVLHKKATAELAKQLEMKEIWKHSFDWNVTDENP